MNAFEQVKGGLIVSCQALADEPMFGSEVMAKFALAAKQGGAKGIRANTIPDIRAIKKTVDLPVIGIIKKDYPDSEVYITPTFVEAKALIDEGVDVIALDGTRRSRPAGETLEGLGFTVEDFGGDLLVRAIPCDVPEAEAAACLSELAQQMIDGRKLDKSAVYDDLLHTVAFKGAIKGGQHTDPQEIAALVAELMSRDDIKHCPHGRPVCITLSRATLERQFKRT